MATEQALDSRARRAAHRAGYVARKSRWRSGSVDNYGGFAIFDPSIGCPVWGWRYDLSAEEVLEWCADDDAEPNTEAAAELFQQGEILNGLEK